MAKRTFSTTALIVVFCFGLANIAIAKWSNRLPARKKLEEIARGTDSNVLLLGNSLLDGTVVPEVFRKTARLASANLIPVNAALGASLPPEQYLLFKQGMRHPGIKVVVIGFFDFQLTQSTKTKTTDLIGNRAVSYDSRIDARDAESIYGFEGVDRLEFRVFRTLPLLAYRSNVWKYIELLRRRLSELGMPRAEANSFGRVADFQALEAANLEDFNEEADRFISHPESLNQPMQRIFTESNARKSRLIFLLMPISPYHRLTFYSQKSWLAYVQTVRRWAAEHGVGFIDAGLWFVGEDDFADRLHLKSSRHPFFTEKLAQAIALDLATMRSESANPSVRSISNGPSN